MAFITIVRARDDGDYESVAALSTDHEDTFAPPKNEWILQMLEHLRDLSPGDKFYVTLLDDVSFIVEAYTFDQAGDYEQDVIDAFEAGHA